MAVSTTLATPTVIQTAGSTVVVEESAQTVAVVSSGSDLSPTALIATSAPNSTNVIQTSANAATITTSGAAPAQVLKVTEQQAAITSVAPGAVSVISAGIQGPSGPGVPIVSGVAGATVSANTAVALMGGQVVSAQSGDTSQAGNVVGISLNGGQAGTIIDIQQVGEMVLSAWNWVLGQPVFVGPNGPLTQVPPTSGFAQIVGVPVAANSISIGLQPPVIIA
ncbi:MAG: hypothetical protein ACYC46_15965 [Acidobacteriaceae bacterium]